MRYNSIAPLAKSATIKPSLEWSIRERMMLVGVLVIAFVIRVGWRLPAGNESYWASGYKFYYNIATDGDPAALRTPLYPLVLSMTTILGKNYLAVVIPQALMGVGTVLCAFFIGLELFGKTAGLLASAITAIYPYYVVHDTALQETGIFTLATAVATWLLLRAQRSSFRQDWAIAGLILGLAVLTRATLLPFAALAFVWFCFVGEGSWIRRFQRSVVTMIPFAALFGLWLGRNYILLGMPIVSSESGACFWSGNNPQTFSHYPKGSIDASDVDALMALTRDEKQQLDALSTDPLGLDDWFMRRGLAYVQTHPWVTLCGAFRKVAAAFSWFHNPTDGTVKLWAHLLSYGPISLLAMLGMWKARHEWKLHGLIYLLFISFIGVTAVFFGHTGHRSYLDVYLIIFASHAVCGIFGLQKRVRDCHDTPLGPWPPPGANLGFWNCFRFK